MGPYHILIKLRERTIIQKLEYTAFWPLFPLPPFTPDQL